MTKEFFFTPPATRPKDFVALEAAHGFLLIPIYKEWKPALGSQTHALNACYSCVRYGLLEILDSAKANLP